jgi:hypothetical protein
VSRIHRHARLKDLAKREEISAYVVPEHISAIVHGRVVGMVHYFHDAVRGVDYMTAHDYVEGLAQSAYLQGLTDAATAMVMTVGPHKGD